MILEKLYISLERVIKPLPNLEFSVLRSEILFTSVSDLSSVSHSFHPSQDWMSLKIYPKDRLYSAQRNTKTPKNLYLHPSEHV